MVLVIHSKKCFFSEGWPSQTWGQFGFEPQSYSCTIVASSGHSFLPVVAGLGVALPLITIAGSYSAIYCRVVNTGRATRRAAGAGDLAGDLSIEVTILKFDQNYFFFEKVLIFFFQNFAAHRRRPGLGNAASPSPSH